MSPRVTRRLKRLTKKHPRKLVHRPAARKPRDTAEQVELLQQQLFGTPKNPLEEMPRGVNLRQTLLQRPAQFSQPAPMTQMQGDLFNMRNEFTKHGDLLRQTKAELKMEQERRRADHERRAADNVKRAGEQKLAFEDQRNERKDELEGLRLQRAQEELSLNTLHAQAMYDQHQMKLQMADNEHQQREVKRQIQELNDKGISLEYARQIERGEQELKNATAELELLQTWGKASTKGTSVASTKLIAGKLQMLVSYCHQVSAELDKLRTSWGSYEAVKGVFNVQDVSTQANTLEALRQANADRQGQIDQKRAQIQSVRDLEMENTRAELQAARLSGEMETLKEQTSVKNVWGLPTPYAKRRDAAVKMSGQVSVRSKFLEHETDLLDADMESVLALEQQNKKKEYEQATLEEENKLKKGVLDTKEFKEDRETVLKELAKSTLNIEKAQSERKRYSQRMARRYKLEEDAAQIADDEKVQTAVNTGLKSTIEGTTFTEAQEKAVKDLGKSKADMSKLEREFKQHMSKLQEADSIESDLRRTQTKHDILKAQNDSAETSVVSTTKLTDTGKLQAQIEAEDRRAKQQKAYRTASDDLVQSQAKTNAMETNKSVTDTYDKIASKMVQTAAKETEKEAHEKLYRETQILWNKQAAAEAQRQLGERVNEVRTMQSDATVVQALNGMFDEDTRARETNVRVLRDFQSKYTTGWENIRRQLHDDFNWDNMAVNDQGVFLQMLADVQRGNSQDSESYKTKFGVDISLT